MVLEHSPLFVLDLGLDIVDSVGGLDLESDGFTRKAAIVVRNKPSYTKIVLRFYENLHLGTSINI